MNTQLNPFQVHPVLTLEQIESTAAGFLDDLQREANRAVRRHDSQKALAVLEAVEYVEKFLYTLSLRANAKTLVHTRVYSRKAPPIRIFQKK